MTDFSFLKNFKVEDFQCHCPACAHDPSRPYTKTEVMRAVQALRDRMREPLVITRGVSCAAHNKAVGGAGDSRHLPQHADAVDIACADSHEAFIIINYALNQGDFTAFRVYPHHVHLDARPGKAMFIASPE